MKKQALELQHVDFYKTHGALVLEQVLQGSILKEAKKESLLLNAHSIRNLWKDHPIFKTIALHKGLFHLSCELTHQTYLRVGYDHYFSDLNELKSYFPQGSSIQDKSSIDGLEIALLINLSLESDEESSGHEIFPFMPGSVCFFHPKRGLHFADIAQAKGPFLLLTYCKKAARYIYQPADPFTHEGKKEGLVFGDLLQSQQHPLMCKS